MILYDFKLKIQSRKLDLKTKALSEVKCRFVPKTLYFRMFSFSYFFANFTQEYISIFDISPEPFKLQRNYKDITNNGIKNFHCTAASSHSN